MKFIIILALCIVAAIADKDATIVQYDNVNDGTGNYAFNYETSNGHVFTEEASLKNVGSEDEALAVRGSYTYVGPDGVTYTVNYIADENGFQPQGAHLPVA